MTFFCGRIVVIFITKGVIPPPRMYSVFPIFLCGFLSFFLSLIFVFATMKLAKKYNWYDEVDPRKIHNGSVPRLGGLGLFLSFCIVYVFYRLFFHNVYFDEMPFFIGGVVIWLCGIVDDFCNLRARVKFVIQFISIAVVVYLSPFYLDNIFSFNLPSVEIFGTQFPLLGKFLTFCWIIFLVNAFNLIDGIDWLCSGICLFAIGTIGFLFITNQINASFPIILCGSILGFMVFNKPSAKIFLGDGGSQTLGYCVAVIPLFLNQGIVSELKIIIMILLAVIPGTDVIAAIWRRLREHRSIFSTDRGHIHHKLLNIGFTKLSALLYLLILQFMTCLAICISQYLGLVGANVLLIGSFIIIVIFFVSIHFLNRYVNKKGKGLLSENAQKEH